MRRSVEASVEIEAPVETVYGYWQTFENLSRFMSKVDGLLTEDQELSHWTLDGSYGATVEFNALTTKDEENRALGRETAEAPSGPSGQVRFEEIEPDLTRVEITIYYTGSRGSESGEAAAAAPKDPQLMLYRDLGDLKETLQGRVMPEERQYPSSAATARSELKAFIAGGVGSALLTGLVLVLASRAHGKRVATASRAGSSTGYLVSAHRYGCRRNHIDSRGR